jgi:hypothetical protein
MQQSEQVKPGEAVGWMLNLLERQRPRISGHFTRRCSWDIQVESPQQLPLQEEEEAWSH